MQKFASKLLTMFMLVVYTLAFMGFTIHECHSNHTAGLVSVLVDGSCNEQHRDSGQHPEDHHCHTSGHDLLNHIQGPLISTGECCNNVLHVLSGEQLNSHHDNNYVKVAVLYLVNHFISNIHILCDSARRANAFVFPSLPAGRDILANYSVIRV